MDTFPNESYAGNNLEKLVETGPTRQFKQNICVLLLLKFQQSFSSFFSLDIYETER